MPRFCYDYDPFAALRRKDTLTLHEAAAGLCKADPDLPYNGKDADERNMRHRIDARRRALIAAIEADELPAKIKLQEPATANTRGGWVHGSAEWNMRDAGPPEPHTPLKPTIDADKSTILRADLITWAEGTYSTEAFREPEAGTATAEPESAAAEMNADRALAAMALLLAQRAPTFRRGEHPNKARIASATAEAAGELFGADVAGFEQFRKRLARALKLYPEG